MSVWSFLPIKKGTDEQGVIRQSFPTHDDDFRILVSMGGSDSVRLCRIGQEEENSKGAASFRIVEVGMVIVGNVVLSLGNHRSHRSFSCTADGSVNQGI